MLRKLLKTKKVLFLVCGSVIFFILLILFDKEIFELLSKFETSRTLLKNKNFWNARLHDWLGDIVTLIGVMLAFCLPFLAQVTQWVVSTHGITSFPRITKKELRINRLLLLMIIFVGVIIFWRLFIYDISPYTSIVYIVANLVIAVTFIWILFRIYRVIEFILKCTFDFEKFIVQAAYNRIFFIDTSIPTPLILVKRELGNKFNIEDYILDINILSDYEVAEFKRGRVGVFNKSSFEELVWRYISVLLFTETVNNVAVARKLQVSLSSTIKNMSVVFGRAGYSRYIDLVEGLVFNVLKNRGYYILFSENDKNDNYVISGYYTDILYLAEEIEGKANTSFFPILSCPFLMNYSFSYLNFLNDAIFDTAGLNDLYKSLDKLDDEIILLAENLIAISSKNKLIHPLMKVYDHLYNDTKWKLDGINLSTYKKNDLERASSLEAYKYIRLGLEIKSEEELQNFFNLFISPEINTYFSFSLKDIEEILREFCRCRYRFKAELLVIYWLSRASFDTSIIVRVLEQASPIQKFNFINVGEHIIPTNLPEMFKKYLISQDISFRRYSFLSGEVEEYKIAFTTILLHILAKKIISSEREVIGKLVMEFYSSHLFSVRDLRSIYQVADNWGKYPKGVNDNKGILELCMTYGISFDELKEFYFTFLSELLQKNKEAIDIKASNTPIDKIPLNEFFLELEEIVSEGFQALQNIIENENIPESRLQEVLSCTPLYMCVIGSGIHVSRCAEKNHFKSIFNKYLYDNFDKTLVIDRDRNKNVEFYYGTEGNELCIKYKYYFYFK